jgi:hypothetical protein
MFHKHKNHKKTENHKHKKTKSAAWGGLLVLNRPVLTGGLPPVACAARDSALFWQAVDGGRTTDMGSRDVIRASRRDFTSQKLAPNDPPTAHQY